MLVYRRRISRISGSPDRRCRCPWRRTWKKWCACWQEPLALAHACDLRPDHRPRTGCFRARAARDPVRRDPVVLRSRGNGVGPQSRSHRAIGRGVAIQHRMAFQGEDFRRAMARRRPVARRPSAHDRNGCAGRRRDRRDARRELRPLDGCSTGSSQARRWAAWRCIQPPTSSTERPHCVCGPKQIPGSRPRQARRGRSRKANLPTLPSFRTIISMRPKTPFRTSRPSSRSSTASRCMVTATSRISRRRYRHRCPTGRLFGVTVAINRASRKRRPVNTPSPLWPVDAAIPVTFMDTPMRLHGPPIYRHLARRLSGSARLLLLGVLNREHALSIAL